MAQSNLPSVLTRDGVTLTSLLRDAEKIWKDVQQKIPPSVYSAWGELVGTRMPKIDMVEGHDVVELHAEVPGIDPKDLNVTLSDNKLTLSGEKKVVREAEGKNWHIAERSHGAFSRSISLPYNPDPAKVEAVFDKGVLLIRLPKPPVAITGTKISVKPL